MATFHVVPRGDAVSHNLHGTTCECSAEVKSIASEESRGGYDVWVYHRRVTLEEAIFVGEHGPEMSVPEIA